MVSQPDQKLEDAESKLMRYNVAEDIPADFFKSWKPWDTQMPK